MTRVDGDRENPEISNCLGVFGLNFNTTERDLEKEFSKFGTLEKVQVVLDGPSKRSRGFSFIYFVEPADATRARDALNGTEISGFKIRVDYSITKMPHKPTPGVYFHHGHATRPGFRGDRGGRGRGGFERRGGYEGRGGYERGYRSRGGGRGRGYHPYGGERERSYYPRERPPGYESSRSYYDKYDRYEREYERPPPAHYKESREYRDDRYYKDRYYEDRERYYKEKEYRDYEREKYYKEYERERYHEREREPRPHYDKYAEPPRPYAGHSSRRSPSPRPLPPRPRDY